MSSLRQALRPYVHGARRARQRLGRILRPPQPWDGRHDAALLHFPPWAGEADGRHRYDFLGVRTDPAFRLQMRADPAGPLETDYPPPHAAYFEMAFVLAGVLAAEHTERFAMLELGAGYGPWLVTAHRAVQLSAPKPVRLVGVEMVPDHYRFMHEHMRNNGIDPSAHTLLHGAVSDHDGEARYLPEPDPALDYGQQLVRRGRRESEAPRARGSSAAETILRESRRPIRVPCFDLARLVREHGPFDLVHVDIQGEELRALGSAMPELRRRAARLLVATHSRRIHRSLRRSFRSAGWRSVYDFRCRARERTPLGDVQFLDGLLALVNSSPVE